MAKITLDMETFKALASPTRLDVLKQLDDRRKTVTELARDMELNKATVHEHIGMLVKTGLVRKVDEGRKWIYYELTWEGKRLLHPTESTAFSVLLGLGAAAAAGSVLSAIEAASRAFPSPAAPPPMDPPAGDAESTTTQDEEARDDADGGAQPEGSGGGDAGSASGAPAEDSMAAAPEADNDVASSDGSFLDGVLEFVTEPFGTLAVALIILAIVLLLMAIYKRRV